MKLNRKELIIAATILVAVLIIVGGTIAVVTAINNSTEKTDSLSDASKKPAITPESQLLNGNYDAAKSGFEAALSDAEAAGNTEKIQYYKQQLDFLESTPKPEVTTPPQEPEVEEYTTADEAASQNN